MARSHTALTNFVSNLGALLGFSPAGNLTSNGIPISSPAVDALISVSAEAATTANVRDIIITLKDSEGRAIDYVEEVDVALFLDAARVAYVVTGGSTGIEIDDDPAAGAIQALVAKKRWKAVTSAAGVLNLKWTDTGTEVAFLGVRLPSGRWVMSSALTNA